MVCIGDGGGDLDPGVASRKYLRPVSTISIQTRCKNDGFGIEIVRLYLSVGCTRNPHKVTVVALLGFHPHDRITIVESTVNRGKVQPVRTLFGKQRALSNLHGCIGPSSRSGETATPVLCSLLVVGRSKKLGRYLATNLSRLAPTHFQNDPPGFCQGRGGEETCFSTTLRDIVSLFQLIGETIATRVENETTSFRCASAARNMIWVPGSWNLQSLSGVLESLKINASPMQ